MTIQILSRMVFERTREFFHDTATSKSANKKYRRDAPVADYKKERRKMRRRIARTRLRWIWSNVRPAVTLREYGKWLHDQGDWTAGNCPEMSCVAFYYLALGQEQTGLEFPVRYFGLQRPGDHAFLIAGYVPPDVAGMPYGQYSTDTLETMCNAIPAAEESYVVDVWAGIFCPTREYPLQVKLKMRKWNERGKQVYWGHARDWVDVEEDGEYANSLVDSCFYIRDPGRSFPPP